MKFSGFGDTTANRGFTLIEVLIVIGIIAVLAAAVLVAINPARQFAQANDSQRTSNVNAILNAIGQYVVDHQGEAPSDIPVGDASDAAQYDVIGDGSGEADICDELVPDYMSALPVDPKSANNAPIEDCTSSYDTGYKIIKDTVTKRITVSAPNAQTGQVKVTR